MYFRDRVGVRTALVAVTGTSVQTVVPAQSGYSIFLTQVAMHEEQGGIRDVLMYQGNDLYINFTIGASGTIVWDYQLAQNIPIGSGFNASLNIAGNVRVLARYVLVDERTPPVAALVTRTIRAPNFFGHQ